MPPAHLKLRSDERLVSLFRSGREEAFDVLHERHHRRLHGAAARALRGSGVDVEGVVQEAFLRAHRQLREDRRPIEIKPWLHRVVRNLCIDELRRERPTAELVESDRASEDLFSTLSHRHELRRLIEDLADLPEQQRAALLMRELDGLSHEQVASALDISPAASRQLVKRARNGLVAAAEARDAECAEIRDALLTAHDERRRPSEHALRHLKRCAACSEFRDGLKATRAKLRVLVPPIGLGPLAGLLASVTSGGAGVATKVAATTAVVAAAAGGVAVWQAGETHTVRGTSPGVEAGGKTLIGKPIRPGTKLPASVAIANLTVRIGDGAVHHAKVTCPPGMISNGLAQPRTQDGKEALGNLRMYNLSDRDTTLLERRTGRRTAVIDYRSKKLATPLVISVGTLCKRR
jgi:RNA polymerase sigma factor (sigma-70 family)